MSVYDIGKFRVQQLHSGNKVSWQHNGQWHSIDLDLEWMINDHITAHLLKVAHLIQLMEQSPDDLLNDPIGILVISTIPDSDIIPGRDLPEHLIPEFHQQQILKGYNRNFKTQFTLEMVKEFIK